MIPEREPDARDTLIAAQRSEIELLQKHRHTDRMLVLALGFAVPLAYRIGRWKGHLERPTLKERAAYWLMDAAERLL